MNGLVLSGGAARAAGHIGVLKVFEREGIGFDAVAGCSAGSLIAALYCTGRFSAAMMEEAALDFRMLGMIKPVWPVNALSTSRTLYDYARKFIGDITFEELKIPLFISVTDFLTGNREIISKGAVARAIEASCALPVFFSPVSINGRLYIDGGMSSQIPVLALRGKCNRIVAVDVNWDTKRPNFKSIFGVIYQFLALQSIKSATEERKFADFEIMVSARDVELYHFNKTALMIKRGEESANAKIKELREQFF